MSGDTAQPVCICGHTHAVHGATCAGNIVGQCPCPAWTPKPDVATDPFSRGWR